MKYNRTVTITNEDGDVLWEKTVPIDADLVIDVLSGKATLDEGKAEARAVKAGCRYCEQAFKSSTYRHV